MWSFLLTVHVITVQAQRLRVRPVQSVKTYIRRSKATWKKAVEHDFRSLHFNNFTPHIRMIQIAIKSYHLRYDTTYTQNPVKHLLGDGHLSRHMATRKYQFCTHTQQPTIALTLQRRFVYRLHGCCRKGSQIDPARRVWPDTDTDSQQQLLIEPILRDDQRTELDTEVNSDHKVGDTHG